MNFASVEKLANAVLYEGYMLYPYRATSTKNKQRWNFGTLYPESYAQAQHPSEPSSFSAEMLIIADASATLELRLRCLQLVPRDGNAWEEGVEHSTSHSVRLNALQDAVASFDVRFENEIALSAQVEVRAKQLSSGTYKLHITVRNTTESRSRDREQALRASLVSAHIILALDRGEFVSMLDGPTHLREAIAECDNKGVFPVLVGDEQRRDMMLCSPIILYDFPQIAPESAGDFFDGTEMDEMLALRVMTLTDEEKQEVRCGDERARALLERTETLPQEHLTKVHGAIRGMRRVQEGE